MRPRTVSGTLPRQGLVVVVDDEDDVRNLIATLLRDAGFTTASFGHGRDALDFLSVVKERPALIVTDLVMPIMDGWELVSTLRGDSALSSIPVMVVTGSRRQAKLPGVPIVEKPIDPETLVNKARELCQKTTTDALPQQA